MKDAHYQIVGLVGFIIAGVMFTIVGLKAKDLLTTLGSIIWTLSCLVWLIPFLKRRTT